MDAKYVHPQMRQNKGTANAISRLTTEVGTCLGKIMNDVFEINQESSLVNLVDIVKTEFVPY